MANTTLPDQRVPSSRKLQKDWYIPMAEYVISLAISSDNKTDTKKFLEAANGIISKKDYDYVMATYMDDANSTEIEKELAAVKLGKLRDIDILTPIKERDMGEFISSYHNYQVYSNDPEAIFKRNSKIGKKVMEKMVEKLQQVLINKPEEETINIKDFIDNELSIWKDERVEEEQAALELLNSTIEARRKYTEAYFYWWACQEVITYRYLQGNDVVFEVINPMEYRRVDSGNFFIEDDQYGLREYYLNIYDVIDRFGYKMNNGLTEKQIKALRDIADHAISDVGYIDNDVFVNHKDLFGVDPKFNGRVAFTKKGLLVKVDHYFFTTEVKRGILKYNTPMGTVDEMEVDENYELDVDNGDISIEWVYTSEKHEGWRFGEKQLNIYLAPRCVQLPRELVSNSSMCKSPYNGITYLSRSNVKKPIAYRILPNIVLYKIYSLLEERWMSKFKSWMLIPESLLATSKEMTTSERLQQADEDSIFAFNDTKIERNPQVVSYLREVATTAVVEYLKIINATKQSIKQDAWELANMNDTRLGNTSQYKGKDVTRGDYEQALKGTVWSLEIFNLFREKDYMANLDFSRAAWIDGKTGSYIDPNTGQVVTVTIDGESHYSANVGLFISNSADLANQANDLKQLAFAAGQNNDPELAAEAVTNRNIGKLKEIIRKAKKANQEFQMKLSTAKEEVMARIKETELADNREQRQHESDMLDRELANDFNIARLEAETEMAINEARLEVDRNGNGYIDKAEAENSSATIAAKNRAVDILQQKKDNLKLLEMGMQNLRDKRNASRKIATTKSKKR